MVRKWGLLFTETGSEANRDPRGVGGKGATDVPTSGSNLKPRAGHGFEKGALPGGPY